MDFIYYIIFVLFMMEFVPVECIKYLSPHGRKRQRGPCVGSTWQEFGRFRFWQREKCVNRRTKYGGGRKQANQLELFDFPSMETGPDRNLTYNPTYGYEPYWADGGWVFDRKPIDENDHTKLCGVKCPNAYIEYGVICGRDEDFNYQTFANYCALKNMDCNKPQRWKILYKGACYREMKFNNISNTKKVDPNGIINGFVNRQSSIDPGKIGTVPSE